MNAELSLHSHDFTVNMISYDEIAFLLDVNISEHLSFLEFCTLAVNKNKK